MNAAVMPAFRETLTEDEIRITPEAQTQLSKLLEQVEDDDIEAIRIYVTGGGCSGMTYGMTFTDQQTPYDRVMEYADFRLFIDAVALNYLHGVEIDYISRPTGASFVFNNVFTSTGGSGTCGACGAATGAGGGCG
ncbi:MAG: iron-sulfur cluster assembly accessory protein [Gammaproteobacteria bacterium]|nr:iron-sulfur cluster assembly accessory protein [Gammaproteobacteria bacterium]